MPTTGPGQSGQPPRKRVRFRNDDFFVQVHIYDPNPMKWAAFDEQSQPLRQKISGGNNIRAEERKREKYPKKEETDGWRLMSVDDAIQRFEPGQNSVARAIETERCANIVEECWEDRMSVTEVESLDEENGTTGADELFCETKIIPLELEPADDDEQMQQAEFVESAADADGCEMAADEDQVEPDNHWRSLDGENRTRQLLSDIGATLGVPEMTAEERANALERCGTKSPRDICAEMLQMLRAPLRTEVSDNEHSKEQPEDREEEEAAASTNHSDMNYIYHQSEPEDSEDSNLVGLGCLTEREVEAVQQTSSATLVAELDETRGIDNVTTHELPTEDGGEEDIIELDGDQTGQEEQNVSNGEEEQEEEQQNVLPTEKGEDIIVVNGHQTGQQEEQNVSNGEEEQEAEAHDDDAEEGEIEDDDDEEEEEEEESVLPPGLFVDSSGEDNENEVLSGTPQHTQQEHSLVELTEPELSPSRRARPTSTTALTLSPQGPNSNAQDERPAVLEARQTSPTSVLSSPTREARSTTQSPSEALQKDRRTPPAQESVPSPRASPPLKAKRARSKRKKSKRSATPETSTVVNELLNAPSRPPKVYDVPKLTANTYRKGRAADPDWWLNTKQKKRSKKQRKRDLERLRHKNDSDAAQLNETAGPSLASIPSLLSTPIGMDICSPQKSPPPRPPHPIPPPPPPPLLQQPPQLVESVPMPSELFMVCGRFFFRNPESPRPVTDFRLHPFVNDCFHLFTYGNCAFRKRCKFSHGDFEQTIGWLDAWRQFKAMEESLRSPMARASKSPTASPTARSSKSHTAYSRHSNSPTARLSRSKSPTAHSSKSPTGNSRHSNSPTARLSRSKLPKAYSYRSPTPRPYRSRSRLTLARSRRRSRSPMAHCRRQSRSKSPTTRPYRSRSNLSTARHCRSRSRSPTARRYRSRSRSPTARRYRSRSRSPMARSRSNRSRGGCSPR